MEEKRCLNCGSTVDDAFCPHCGQRTSVSRLSFKTAVIDNTWAALRMDVRVVPTAWMLITRPWVVIRDYLNGKRVLYTQPVRFLVILCFVNLLMQIFIPQLRDTDGTAVANDAGGSAWTIFITAFRGFLHDSEVAKDIIDSVLFAPVVYLIYLPWGSRRFNLAEYSTAYLYLCGAGLVIDVILTPVELLFPFFDGLIEMVWWCYLSGGLVYHAFHIRPRWKCALMVFINFLLVLTVGIFNHIFLYGID